MAPKLGTLSVTTLSRYPRRSIFFSIPASPSAQGITLPPRCVFSGWTRIRPRNCEVIDYGCGSGILGLAALKLGARRVYAVDIDPQALFATRDNAARNGIGTRALQTYCPEELPMHAADLLLANIVARPLIGLAQTFATRVMPGGRVVLSGLLTEQADALAAVYSPWFTFAPAQAKGGWSLLAGLRRPASR